MRDASSEAEGHRVIDRRIEELSHPLDALRLPPVSRRQPRLSRRRRSRRCLGLHHKRSSALPFDLLLAQSDLTVPPFDVVGFVIHKRHGGLDGGLVLPVRPAARRAIFEGVLAGPARRPLGHGLVATPRRRRIGAELPQTGLSGCAVANFCLALWHNRCHGQPWLHEWSK